MGYSGWIFTLFSSNISPAFHPPSLSWLWMENNDVVVRKLSKCQVELSWIKTKLKFTKIYKNIFPSYLHKFLPKVFLILTFFFSFWFFWRFSETFNSSRVLIAANVKSHKWENLGIFIFFTSSAYVCFRKIIYFSTFSSFFLNSLNKLLNWNSRHSRKFHSANIKKLWGRCAWVFACST